jgi:hypothetical protein
MLRVGSVKTWSDSDVDTVQSNALKYGRPGLKQ